MYTPEDALAAFAILLFIKLAAVVMVVIGSAAAVSEIRFRLKSRRYRYFRK